MICLWQLGFTEHDYIYAYLYIYIYIFPFYRYNEGLNPCPFKPKPHSTLPHAIRQSGHQPNMNPVGTSQIGQRFLIKAYRLGTIFNHTRVSTPYVIIQMYCHLCSFSTKGSYYQRNNPQSFLLLLSPISQHKTQVILSLLQSHYKMSKTRKMGKRKVNQEFSHYKEANPHQLVQIDTSRDGERHQGM